MSGSEYTTTPNYGLIKPTPNADNDVWGDHINLDLDTLDSLIKTVEDKTGVTAFNSRTGSVLLTTADVTTALPPAGAQPAMDGAGVPGVASTFSRGDHQHPTDTSRASVASLTAYAPIASPTFTGDPRAPTPTAGDNDTTIATTAFVQTAVGGVPGGAVIADTPPVSAPGALWWDSAGGNLYVRYQDSNSTAWVTASNMQGLADAATKTEVASAQNNVGRNLLHNSLFNVAQRGAGPWTTNGVYTLDRWLVAATLDTISFTRYPLTDGDRAAIGDEAASFHLSNAFTGNAGATAANYVEQRMEGVRRLAGKTVTVSFWAVATASLKIGINAYQLFGTGGSPSAYVQAQATGASVTAGTSWARYSVQLILPSVAGKTLGTNGDDATWLRLFYSAGANTNAAAGNIGVQSGTINLWGVQLEIAAAGQTQPTPLEKPDPETQLRQCQRFYQDVIVGARATVTGVTTVGCSQSWPQMRATPTVTLRAAGFSALAGAPLLTASFPIGGFFGFPATGPGDAYSLNNVYALSADL